MEKRENNIKKGFCFDDEEDPSKKNINGINSLSLCIISSKGVLQSHRFIYKIL